jgi:signal peptide peptidase SppA
MIPHLDQWLGVWAMLPDRLAALHQWAMGVDLHVHLQSEQARAAASVGMGQPAPVHNGIATIGIYGPMMKHQASIGRSTSTLLARRQVRQATADPNVSAILLHIDSPGGTVAGTAELAADVAAAAAAKPTIAYLEDVGASAAYHVASQARRIYANAAALVGSIGTFGVVYDSSRKAERDGIKVHVVRAGAFKGYGTPGTEITAAQLAEHQRLVDGLQAHFTRAVAAGRRMSLADAGKLADGRVHLAADALALRLIDGVQTLDQTYHQLLAGPSPAAHRQEQRPVTSAKEQIDQLVAQRMKEKPRLSLAEARAEIYRENPELRLQWVAEHNDQYGEAVHRRR